MIRLFVKISVVCTAVATLCGCTPHHDVINNSLAVGNIVCTDGEILNYEFFKGSGKEAMGVVFYLNPDYVAYPDVKGYAVYLKDLEAMPLADSLGVEQGTSASLTAMDGFENTFALKVCEDVSSPIVEKMFRLGAFKQSATLPSVAQMRALFYNRELVNQSLSLVGGDVFQVADSACWYWTSTEVATEETQAAWLISMQSGSIQKTPKDVAHKSRPILELLY